MSDKTRERIKRVKQNVILRDGCNCIYCNTLTTIGVDLSFEHIIPVSLGGTTNYINLTIACKTCNNSRGNYDFFDFLNQFNPDIAKVELFKARVNNYYKLKHIHAAISYLEDKTESYFISEIIDFPKYSEYFIKYNIDFSIDDKATRKSIVRVLDVLSKIIEEEI